MTGNWDTLLREIWRGCRASGRVCSRRLTRCKGEFRQWSTQLLLYTCVPGVRSLICVSMLSAGHMEVPSWMCQRMCHGSGCGRYRAYGHCPVNKGRWQLGVWYVIRSVRCTCRDLTSGRRNDAVWWGAARPSGATQKVGLMYLAGLISCTILWPEFSWWSAATWRQKLADASNDGPMVRGQVRVLRYGGP